MKKRIAVCGKGGVGKTALVALLTDALARQGRAGALLVIDADPAVGLPGALGIEAEKTIGAVRQTILAAAREGNEADREDVTTRLDYMILEALRETEHFSFLAMGRSESRGCYCSVNGLLRAALNTLTDRFDTILIDGEAGLEQLNRQVTGTLDHLIVLTDPSRRGRETVAHIRHMLEEEHIIACADVGVVINHFPLDDTSLCALTAKQGLPVWDVIPVDEELARLDRDGRPLCGLSPASPARQAAERLSARLMVE